MTETTVKAKKEEKFSPYIKAILYTMLAGGAGTGVSLIQNMPIGERVARTETQIENLQKNVENNQKLILNDVSVLRSDLKDFRKEILDAIRNNQK